MYCYCIEKSENQLKIKRSANKNGSHFENFWGCLQVFVPWGLAGMKMGVLFILSVFLALYWTVEEIIQFNILPNSFFFSVQPF